MIDRIFGALLTFCLLAGGTVAVASAMFEHDRQADAIRTAKQATPVIQLPTVEITARRTKVAQTEPADATLEPTARQLQ
jgi:hypothetical protein